MSASWKTWSTAIGSALLALGAVGCGAYEPEPEVPQYQYVAPAPRPLTAEELAAQQAAQPQVPTEGEGQDIAIGEDTKADEYADNDPSALTEFKPALEGHGQWVNDATYGTVWVPSSTEVGADFEPYVTAGHWTYADDTDYVWVSDYSWGWAPFHYGRWVMLPTYGWTWIPGRRYAGAWVTWRTAPDYGYIGWAPMAPDFYWYNGYAVGWSFGFYHYYDHYAFCPREHFFYGGGPRAYAVWGPGARVHYERTVEYAPRVAASPTVNGGHVIANPSVNGTGRVAATPSVRRGPAPTAMGIGHDAIVAPPPHNQGLDQARTLATPSTAVAHGAAPPARTASFNGSSGRGPASATMVPSYGQGMRAAPSTGGSQGFASRPSPGFSSGGNNGRVASIPSGNTRSFGPAPSAPSRGGSTFVPHAVTPPPRYSSPSYAAPSYSRPSSPSYAARPSPSYSAPSYAHPSVGASPPAISHSTPSFHASTPSASHPAFASGGGSHFSSVPSHSSGRSSGGRSGGGRRR